MNLNRKLAVGVYGINGFFPSDMKPYQAAAAMFNMTAEPHQELSYDAELNAGVEEILSGLEKLQRPTYNSLFVTGERLRDKKGAIVFGLADPKTRVIVFSEASLQADSRGVFQERILKEVAHLLGHLWGLGHCDDPSCVMYYARTAEDVDAKLPRLCSEHAKLFRQSYKAFIGEE